MAYNVGDKITSKKNHACGSNEWVVSRTGADIKLTCTKCKRAIFLSIDQVKKITKTYQSVNNGN